MIGQIIKFIKDKVGSWFQDESEYEQFIRDHYHNQGYRGRSLNRQVKISGVNYRMNSLTSALVKAGESLDSAELLTEQVFMTDNRFDLHDPNYAPIAAVLFSKQKRYSRHLGKMTQEQRVDWEGRLQQGDVRFCSWQTFSRPAANAAIV